MKSRSYNHGASISRVAEDTHSWRMHHFESISFRGCRMVSISNEGTIGRALLIFNLRSDCGYAVHVIGPHRSHPRIVTSVGMMRIVHHIHCREISSFRSMIHKSRNFSQCTQVVRSRFISPSDTVLMMRTRSRQVGASPDIYVVGAHPVNYGQDHERVVSPVRGPPR